MLDEVSTSYIILQYLYSKKYKQILVIFRGYSVGIIFGHLKKKRKMRGKQKNCEQAF